jgi:twitching motility protein PilT
MNLSEILEKGMALDASDIHISVGIPPMARISGELKPIADFKVTHDISLGYAKEIMNEAQWNTFEKLASATFPSPCRANTVSASTRSASARAWRSRCA